MRDDLHRTPALPRYWRTAVRHAERAADHERLTYDLSRAATQDMDARIRPEFFAGVAEACGGRHGHLFPDSQAGALSSYEGAARTPLEQRLLELARATCLQRPGAPDIAEYARSALFREMIGWGIEHATAAVRQHAGAGEARLLRARLASHQMGCTIELGRQKPPKKLKGMALLDMEAPPS